MSSSQKKTKRCPHFGKPCLEDGCTHWVAYPAERMNELTGAKVTEAVYMCNDLWATKIAFDAAHFADQAGATLDSLRNHVAEGNAAIGGLIFERKSHALQPEAVPSLRRKVIQGPESAARLEGPLQEEDEGQG